MRGVKLLAWIVVMVSSLTVVLQAADLPEILRRGELRHLGVPYANFVTGEGQGLSCELIQRFAARLGVRYVYVKTSWKTVIADLSGKRVKADGDSVQVVGKAPVRGDLIANGLTMLPWRQKVVAYSLPTFPTQVWLVAATASPLTPIRPSGSTTEDIFSVRRLLPGHTLLGISDTCLDPRLYLGAADKVLIKNFPGQPDELTPAVIRGEAEATLLDVPDTLVALNRWPGKFKVIGPVSPRQWMGVAFAKDAPRLRDAFNRFFKEIWKNGSYRELVTKYYPDVFDYYPDFFQRPLPTKTQ